MKLTVIFMVLSFLFVSRTIGTEAIDPKQEVSFLGSFSNMRFTEEHQYGDEAELWRAGDRIIGHFFYSAGLAGDTPAGQIEDVQYNSKSGNLNFTAKLTTGQHYCKVHKDVPSHDLFKFKGKLNANSLSGELIQIQGLDNNQVISQEKVFLKKSDDRGIANYPPETFEAWEKRSRVILEFRGPKW